jgi:hypothetical protein
VPGPRIEVTVKIPAKIHARLVDMAEDREVALEQLCSELLGIATIEQSRLRRAEEFHNRQDPLGRCESV